MPEDEPVVRWLMEECAAVLRGRSPKRLSKDERIKLAVLVRRIDALLGKPERT